MTLTTQIIEKEIAQVRSELDEDKNYRTIIDPTNCDPEISTSELIENCNWESEDLMIGYNQGFIAGLEFLLRLSKQNEIT